jgi:hypothetical protein
VLGAALLLTMLGLVMVLSHRRSGLRWFADSSISSTSKPSSEDRAADRVGGVPPSGRAYRALAYPLLLGTLGLLFPGRGSGVGHESTGTITGEV